MSSFLFAILEGLIGFSSGIVIGSVFIALLIFLRIIPRLLQWAKYRHKFNMMGALLGGTLFGTYLTFATISFSLPYLVLLVWGLLHGIFNGILVAALVEVLHVFPILSRRIGLNKETQHLIMAVVFGKIAGSLFQWLFLSS